MNFKSLLVHMDNFSISAKEIYSLKSLLKEREGEREMDIHRKKGPKKEWTDRQREILLFVRHT